MSQPITPPVEPTEEPRKLTRAHVIDTYWFEFLEYRIQEAQRRLPGGFGLPKTDYSEAAFWEWFVGFHRDVIDEMVKDDEQ